MVGLDRIISTCTGFAKDAMPVDKHPMEMAGSSPAMTGS
jgi:hypothetical protein